MKRTVVGGILAVILATVAGAQTPLSREEQLQLQVVELTEKLRIALYERANEAWKLAQCQNEMNHLYVTYQSNSLKQAIESTRPGFDFIEGQFVAKKESTSERDKQQKP